MYRRSLEIRSPEDAADAAEEARVVAERLGFSPARQGCLVHAVRQLTHSLLKRMPEARGELSARRDDDGARLWVSLSASGPNADELAGELLEGFSMDGEPGRRWLAAKWMVDDCSVVRSRDTVSVEVAMARGPSGWMEGLSSRRKRKVLIIDDEKDLVELLTLRLEGTGEFTVEGAFDGEAGLARASEFKPDVVLLDILMPKLDGEEVCRRLHGMDETRQTPVILMTATNQDVDVAKSDCGAEAALMKPFDSEALIGMIKFLGKCRDAASRDVY